MKIEDADKAVAMATGLGAGCYIFRLTVTDQQGAADSASLTVTVNKGEIQVWSGLTKCLKKRQKRGKKIIL